MSNPSMQDILVGARRKLLASTYFAPLIGVDVGVDQAPKPYTDGWVFRGIGDYFVPERDPENTGLASVSLGFRDPWTSPNDHNTMSFRQLVFIITADQTRISNASSGLIGTRDAELRCDRIAQAILQEFDDKGNQEHVWPNGVFVVSSLLYSDLVIRDVPNADGVVRGDIRFKLVLG